MEQPQVEVVETDVLILGGGMAGCGAAFEAAHWAKEKGLKVTLVEKAAIERSGAVAMGLSAFRRSLSYPPFAYDFFFSLFPPHWRLPRSDVLRQSDPFSAVRPGWLNSTIKARVPT